MALKQQGVLYLRWVFNFGKGSSIIIAKHCGDSNWKSSIDLRSETKELLKRLHIGLGLRVMGMSSACRMEGELRAGLRR